MLKNIIITADNDSQVGTDEDNLPNFKKSKSKKQSPSIFEKDSITKAYKDSQELKKKMIEKAKEES